MKNITTLFTFVNPAKAGAVLSTDRKMRMLLKLFLFLLLAINGSSAFAAHAMALGYTPKYPADFTHFDYANPDAPKRGHLVLPALGSYDKFNPFTLKGTAVAGMGVGGGGFVFSEASLMFESLMAQSEDEPFSMYGLLADDIELAPDQLSVTFHLNKLAHFSNGDPVTALDVKYSFETLRSKAASPIFRSYWADIKKITVLDRQRVRFEFAKKNSELHLILGQLPVFSPKWAGAKPFDQLIMKPPIASGPYSIEKYELGKFITYKRNPNYWATNLPSRRGMFNFDRVTFQYYRDDSVLLEAFKAGEFDINIETTARKWARSYVGKRFSSGELIKREFPHENGGGMVGFIFNLRRPLFADVRVRQAIGLAYDFEWLNRQIFYGQYKRSYSYFTNSELAATGMPGPEELEILAPLKDKLRPQVFGPAPIPPSTLPPGSLRQNLRLAKALLAQAGWTYRDGALRNKDGTPFKFEFLTANAAYGTVLAPFARNLEKLGITLEYRAIDPALAQKRLDNFDFDMTIGLKGGSPSPGNELYGEFSSRAAKEPGSENIGGISDPAIDALIDRIVKSHSRADLVNAARALDRVLLQGYYCVPNYYNDEHRIAYRNTLAYPAVLPKQYAASSWTLTTWWEK